MINIFQVKILRTLFHIICLNDAIFFKTKNIASLLGYKKSNEIHRLKKFPGKIIKFNSLKIKNKYFCKESALTDLKGFLFVLRQNKKHKYKFKIKLLTEFQAALDCIHENHPNKFIVHLHNLIKCDLLMYKTQLCREAIIDLIDKKSIEI